MQETLSNLDLSAFDRLAVWYGALPDAAKGVITVAVGAVLAYVVFKIAVRVVKTLLSAVIAAVLAFLIGTVPGNLLLGQAVNRIEERAGATISQIAESLNR